MSPDAAIDVRTITPDEVPAWVAALNTGFQNASGDADAEARRPSIDPDRTIGAFDGDRVVATFRSFPTELTLPGTAEITVSAITAVSTTATHRRRGLARRMMAHDLTAAKERGEPGAALIAAEWPIYGRFGFGMGTETQGWRVDTSVARIARPVAGRTRMIDAAETRRLAPEIFDRHRRHSPGEINRTPQLWDVVLGVVHYPSWGEPTKKFSVLAEDEAGTPIGLARYTFADKWTDRRPAGTITIDGFISTGPEATSLLWEYLIGIDWATTVVQDMGRTDDLLPWLLTDHRHAAVTERGDHLWWRPLDVPAVLSARSYPNPGTLVLEVTDPMGLTGGRFRLEGGPQGGSCTPTTESADITLGIGALSAAALGTVRPSLLAAAGQVDEHTARGLVKADDLLRCRKTPYCSVGF
ncbi:GNAT family N-acetyltransferase [Nakamurella sp. YIM 132087]|uniref:GNAT family N-acetyltransferase n=1 Tax=Nakamurella alba TaxID=2665158 RepID=A0A7K1FN97_9ACTN|nr:GNAT family N-acetyltransferase [Nakamurella alba]MTD15641.1 GNAT family N-acetyltransferase [Nakamurella alba]